MNEAKYAQNKKSREANFRNDFVFSLIESSCSVLSLSFSLPVKKPYEIKGLRDDSP
jgi:hypothetical protein